LVQYVSHKQLRGKELKIKQLWVVQTTDEATCLPIPGLSDIICSPFTYKCYQHFLCKASIFVVISLDDWPTAYSVHSRCNEIIGLKRTEHCILASSQSEKSAAVIQPTVESNSHDQLLDRLKQCHSHRLINIHLNSSFSHAPAQRLTVLLWLSHNAQLTKPCLTYEMALQLHTIRHSFANKYLGPCCVSMVTNTQYMIWDTMKQAHV
jgi:hypothetical protein